MTPDALYPPRHLEDITLFNVEVDLPYQDWYDNRAKVLDIGPGQMLNWPLNAPHRVENLDTFSVSMTISYTDDEIRRSAVVNFANGMLRHRFDYQPKSRNVRGPSYFAKRVMGRLLRNSRWIKRERGLNESAEQQVRLGRFALKFRVILATDEIRMIAKLD